LNSKIQSAAASVDAARIWEAKNQPVWTHRCLSSALLKYLSVAVCELDTPKDALAWIRENGVDELYSEHADLSATVLSEIEQKKYPMSVLGAPYSHLVFSHFGWLLGNTEAGRFFASLGCNSKLGGPFWAIYANCHQALIRGDREFETASSTKLRKWERHWGAYVSLMNALIAGKGLKPTTHAVDDLFSRRNRDPSFDDWYEIEGSKRQQARWDFRKEAILEVATSARSPLSDEHA
jgi:hypothetical protein